MSRMYWHTLRDGVAELSEADPDHAGERAYETLLDRLDGLTEAADTRARPSPLRRLLPPDSFTLGHPPGDPRWLPNARNYLRWFRPDSHLLLPDGRRDRTWHVALNTAVQLGSDPVRLLLRLLVHAKDHAYVDGPDRGWLAETIERGLRDGALRGGMGWDTPHPHARRPGAPSVVELLRRGTDSRVVLSASSPRVVRWTPTPEGFPTPEAARWLPPDWTGPADWHRLSLDDQRAWVAAHSAPAGELDPDDPHFEQFPEDADQVVPGPDAYPDPDGEWWAALGTAERWRLAEAEIIKDPWLRLSPATLPRPEFGLGLTAADLNQIMAGDA